MKKIIVGLVLLIPLELMRGQDKIITVLQDTIHCRITSISSTHIQYEQKVENLGYVGRFIPAEQVSEYLRISQQTKINSYDKVSSQKSKPTQSWLLCASSESA